MAKLQAKHNNAARLILVFPPRASASDAVGKLFRRSDEHVAIFTNKSVNNLFQVTVRSQKI